MSGKRILDAIALLRATRNVAYNHFAIRVSQAELYSRTSSITKGLAQRYPVTSSLISQRFSQSAYNHNTDDNIPHEDKHVGPQVHAKQEAGIQQDHHYERSEDNTTGIVAEEPGMEVEQAKAKRHPLPDGTIPPSGSPIDQEKGDPESENRRPLAEHSRSPLDQSTQDAIDPASSGRSTIPNPTTDPLSAQEARVAQRQSEDPIPSKSAEPPSEAPEFSVDQEKDIYYQAPGQAEPVLSALPRMRVPKTENDVQGGDSHIPKDINADVYYSGTEQGEQAAEPTEEQLNQLFHTPRAARLLGKKDKYMPGGKKTFHTSAAHRQNAEAEKQELQKLGQEMVKDVASADVDSDSKPYQMRESRVPSSRIGRLFEYGGLAASMAFGAASSGNMLSPANMERLVAKLSKMRGAALKLGQMVSFQDIKMLPPAIVEVLQRVQDSADYMPASQRDKVIRDNLGSNWRDMFESFEEKPMAAASIGQVHGAVLKSGQAVAVKVQYPGVADSISSDLNNLSLLLHATKLLPKGLYLDKTIANARTELAWECDYIREAGAARRFRELLADDTEVFAVPKIIDEASGKQVLTMERMEGVAATKIRSFSQEQRDWIGSQILRLCLREIMEFKFMQTDPNWTNFLYNRNTNKLELLDFGASRDYPEKFVKLYSGVLQAASKQDRKQCEKLSIELGYLTGYDSKAMVNAHIDSVMTLAEPFMDFADDIYDFKDQTITDRVRSFIPIMLRERLAPPPEETYSLHRKMSGAFLLCARLGSRVRCKELFHQALKKGNLESK
ncbi:hypothetical protein PMZ80_007384 [Knufia obscura]|uniref:ABC1 atypical kinase-like domain-containing protein n=1 Tax=Knufia obscura TaxID=1635080 RepID=A0ABR0RH72_9EURO|nr:hypothetical protein PMZ80_007384 [Knufia obscura]